MWLLVSDWLATRCGNFVPTRSHSTTPLLSPPCTFQGIQITRHSAYPFFALSSTAGYLPSGLFQLSRPAGIFSSILLDPFYLLPARCQGLLPAHITSALTFRDFVPRLELLSPFRDFLGISGFLRIFAKVWKCVKWTILIYFANDIWFYF